MRSEINYPLHHYHIHTHLYITSHQQSVHRQLTFRLPIHKRFQPQNERCQLIKAYMSVIQWITDEYFQSGILGTKVWCFL